jgi:GNAT superfamily N-acetyltransferase
MTANLEIRSALPSDRAAMIELTRDVWDGGDYVPYVWDRWLADAEGWLMVAALDGKIVGLQHIDRQPDGTAWVEGIRVAAQAQNRGIGRAMLERAIAWARTHDSPWLRLATSSGNPASNRIAERSGLTLLGTFVSVDAPAGSGAAGNVRLALPTEFDRVCPALERTLGDNPQTWVYTEGWSAYSLTRKRLRLLLSMGGVIVWGDEPEAIAIATSHVSRPSLRLGLLCGTPSGMAGIACWLRANAADAGLSVVRANVEAVPDAAGALSAAGFRSRHGHSMCLHGLDLRG